MSSNLEATFDYYLNLLGKDIPKPESEYVFAKPRKWRFDRAWVADKVAVELEGGEFVQGRHQRPFGFKNDCEKYNIAVIEGWRVLRFTATMLKQNPEQCIEQLRQLVGLPFAESMK